MFEDVEPDDAVEDVEDENDEDEDVELDDELDAPLRTTLASCNRAFRLADMKRTDPTATRHTIAMMSNTSATPLPTSDLVHRLFLPTWPMTAKSQKT